MKKKIAIITTYPTQYYALKFWKLPISDFFDYYPKDKPENHQFNTNFGKNITCDIPLVDSNRTKVC